MTTDQAALGPTRTRVLRVLRETGRPVSAAEVAGRLGVHPNSARFHLDALVDEGMVERGAEDRSTPGRPTVLYAVSPDLPAEDGGWRELATILAQALASPLPSAAGAAETAGEAHGRALATRRATAGRATTGGVTAGRATVGRATTGGATSRRAPSDAPAEVAEGLRRLGFESTVRSTRTGARIEIRPCPFLDLARSHGEVVCGVHRGLVSGMLGELDPSLALDGLQPFERPDLCVARIRRS
ncbi:helix-turn-helix domain-containing protein [Phycicoccus ginsengisoli]